MDGAQSGIIDCQQFDVGNAANGPSSAHDLEDAFLYRSRGCNVTAAPTTLTIYESMADGWEVIVGRCMPRDAVRLEPAATVEIRFEAATKYRLCCHRAERGARPRVRARLGAARR